MIARAAEAISVFLVRVIFVAAVCIGIAWLMFWLHWPSPRTSS